MKILSDHDVVQCLEIRALISAIETAFKAPPETYLIPPRTMLTRGKTTILVMPCYGDGLLGVKIVVMDQQPNRGPRTVKASYMLYDAASGKPLVMLEADALTDLRTAATSAIATRALSRPESKVLGIFGAGREARAHVPAILAVRPIERVLVCASSEARSRAFAESLRTAFRISAHPAEPDACAGAADIVCTCTTCVTPLFDGRVLRPGTHLNLVGAFRPDQREVDDETIRRSCVVVDTFQGCREAGDLLIPQKNGIITQEHIRADLRGILTGQAGFVRGPEDITLFKSVGFALEDFAAVIGFRPS